MPLVAQSSSPAFPLSIHYYNYSTRMRPASAQHCISVATKFIRLMSIIHIYCSICVTSASKADKERTWSGSRSRADRSPDTEAERRKMSSQSTPSLGVNGNGDLGALGLPHEKMMLVREKKEEIERVSTSFLLLIFEKISSVSNIMLVLFKEKSI